MAENPTISTLCRIPNYVAQICTKTQFLIIGTRRTMSNGRNVGIIIPNGKFRSAHRKPLREVRKKGKVSVNFAKKIKPKSCSNLNIKLRTDQPYCPLIRLLLLIVRPMEPHLRMTFLWALKVHTTSVAHFLAGKQETVY